MKYKALTVGVELREAKSDLPVKSNSFARFFEAVTYMYTERDSQRTGHLDLLRKINNLELNNSSTIR
jgi:hypothetical protein